MPVLPATLLPGAIQRGNKLIEKHDEKGRYTVVIEKGAPACTSVSNVPVTGGRGKTLILFSDDLDKALATFVLANGAAATGQKVTIFFTFWGLNVLKKVQKPSVQKEFLRQDVRHDAAVQFFETEVVADEYVWHGQSHDALPDEARGCGFSGVVALASIGARSGIHRLPDVYGYDGHPARRTSG